MITGLLQVNCQDFLSTNLVHIFFQHFAASLPQACCPAIIKPLSESVRNSCSGLMKTGLMQFFDVNLLLQNLVKVKLNKSCY